MDQSMGWLYLIWGVFLLLVLLTILSGFFTVDTQTAAIVQRFGRFVRVAGPGLNFKTPWIEGVVARLDLRVQQHDVQVETKTKDNVFVKIPVAVQYHVLPEKVYEAFYRLSLPEQQIESYVFNVVLGHVPKMAGPATAPAELRGRLALPIPLVISPTCPVTEVADLDRTGGEGNEE